MQILQINLVPLKHPTILGTTPQTPIADGESELKKAIEFNSIYLQSPWKVNVKTTTLQYIMVTLPMI